MKYRGTLRREKEWFYWPALRNPMRPTWLDSSNTNMGQYRDQRARTHTYTKPILCHWPYKITGSEQWLMAIKRNDMLHLSVWMHVRAEQTDRAGLRRSGFMFLCIIGPLIITFGIFEGHIAFECDCKLYVLLVWICLKSIKFSMKLCFFATTRVMVGLCESSAFYLHSFYGVFIYTKCK